MMSMIVARARKWALECGLRAPIDTEMAERVDYHLRGYGYRVVVKESTGRGRMGTAVFGSNGEPRMWTMDGVH